MLDRVLEQVFKQREQSAAIGVRHEDAPGHHGCRMLYAGAAQIGPMHVAQANAFVAKAESAS